MSFSIGLGQSTIEVNKEELTKSVKICEKCQQDLSDYEAIVSDGKLLVEAMGVRLAEKEEIISALNIEIQNLKIAYNDLVSSNKKKLFWLWLKNIGTGIAIGVVVAFSIII